MTLLTRAALIDKYGLRLSMSQLASVMGMSQGTVRNQIATGEFPIRTYREAGRRFAHYEAVAEYLEARDEEAKKEQRGGASA